MESTARPGPRAVLVAVLVVAILALGAGAYALTRAAVRPADARASVPAASAGVKSPKSARSGAAKGKHPLRARLTAISGSTWTVQPAKGGPVSVIVNGQTKFGSKKAPSTASAFAVGTRIAIVGARVGDRIDATRIMLPQVGQG